MGIKIRFTDGSYYYGYGNVKINSDHYYRTMIHSIVAIKTKDYITPSFTKTDLDGHVWRYDNTKSLGADLLTIDGKRFISDGIDYGDKEYIIILLNLGTEKSYGFNVYEWDKWTANQYFLSFGNTANNPTPRSIGNFRQSILETTDKRRTKIWAVLNNDGDISAEFHWWNSHDTYLAFGGNRNVISGNGELLAPFNSKNVETDQPDPVLPTDPYNKGGSTSASGGGGTFGGGNTIFGGASDSIDIPPLPTASASAAGFITLFNPTLGQLNNLANYMWSDLFSLDTFKKIFADPMDCILGLSIVPVKPASAGTSAVKIGNVSTDVSMNKTSSQYVAVDCGTIDVKEYWGAYLDYAPYTQCEIYLPYVGTKQISVDDVMNKAVHVVYHVDILSGACNAYVKCGDSVLYTFVGQCSSSIPISGNDWTNVLNGAISVAGKIGLAMATGGATALMSGIGAASSIISSSKPTVERSGAMSSTGGLLGIQKPYLILTRPKQALPENQNKYTGYPSFITMALSDCTGYTEIDSVHLENMSCTDEEAEEIENLLKSGVIF